MKYIRKGRPPRELDDWFKSRVDQEGNPMERSYDYMSTETKDAVKECLLEEQGWLCCYTGISINDQSSHIEHFKPQEQCDKTKYEDIDYNNLLAAYPKKETKGGCPFGALAKWNWYDKQLLISPLHPSCETQFTFNLSGEISTLDGNNQAAIETIKRLGLDHGSLTEMRQQAIDEILFSKKRRISEAQLKKIIQGYCSRNTHGKFPHFCFVIVHAAKRLLHKAKRSRKAREAMHRQGLR